MKYGLALIEKPDIDGLNKNDILLLYGLVTDTFHNGSDEVFPIELEAREHVSSAMGFITNEAANLVNYDYENSGLHDYIASILDDTDNENEDHHYQYNGIDIWLSR